MQEAWQYLAKCHRILSVKSATDTDVTLSKHTHLYNKNLFDQYRWR